MPATQTPGKLAGQVAIVTGGSMGIGEATVTGLAALGAQVVIADIAEVQGLKLAEMLGDNVSFFRTDVTIETDVATAIKYAEDTFGPLSIFVNNAGVAGSSSSLEDTSTEGFERTVRINLTSAFIGTKLAARAMRAAGTHGAVVNVTSAAGLRGGLSPSVDYTCSKAGMVMLTQQAACELARDGIRVNSVAPSFVSTPMTEAMVRNGGKESDGPSVEAIITAISSFKDHIANATDIANAILFLASSDAAACTGINILVDTGMLTGVGGKLPFT